MATRKDRDPKEIQEMIKKNQKTNEDIFGGPSSHWDGIIADAREKAHEEREKRK